VVEPIQPTIPATFDPETDGAVGAVVSVTLRGRHRVRAFGSIMM
jgi:hypothetical protein